MNSKNVLSKIAKLLNLEAEVIEFTYAKLADGTIVESPTFDVGEDLFVVSEDGTKSPAPNGFHDLMLKDSEGKENLIKVKTEDGKIVERENVELADVDAEVKKEEPLPGDPTEVNDVKDEKSAGEQIKNLKPSSMMAAEEVEVGPLPQTDGEELPSLEDEIEEEGVLIALKKMVEKMEYRIEEMEKKYTEMEKKFGMEKVEEVKEEKDVKMEEEELPKLDGAPIEEQRFSTEEISKRFGKKVNNAQNSFLSKLYK